MGGKRFLKAKTIRWLFSDWLARSKPQGWLNDGGGTHTGWSPIGHIQKTGPHKGATYMGGVGYYWADPKLKLATIQFAESTWQQAPTGQKPHIDDMDKLLPRAYASFQRRMAKQRRLNRA